MVVVVVLVGGFGVFVILRSVFWDLWGFGVVGVVSVVVIVLLVVCCGVLLVVLVVIVLVGVSWLLFGWVWRVRGYIVVFFVVSWVMFVFFVFVVVGLVVIG